MGNSLSPSTARRVIIIMSETSVTRNSCGNGVIIRMRSGRISVPIGVGVPGGRGPAICLDSMASIAFTSTMFGKNIMSVNDTGMVHRKFY